MGEGKTYKLTRLSHLVAGSVATRITLEDEVWLSCFESKNYCYATLSSANSQIDYIYIKPPAPKLSIAVFHIKSDLILTLEFKSSGFLVGVYEFLFSSQKDKLQILGLFGRAGVNIVATDMNEDEFIIKPIKEISLNVSGVIRPQKPIEIQQDRKQRSSDSVKENKNLRNNKNKIVEKQEEDKLDGVILAPPNKKLPQPETGIATSEMVHDERNAVTDKIYRFSQKGKNEINSSELRDIIINIMKEDGFVELVDQIRTVLKAKKD